MAKNEFLPFGTAANANVLPNANYLALPARSAGFSSGVAKSEQLNTVWRQASVMSSALGQFIADSTGKDVLDNGDVGELQTLLQEALMGILPVGIPQPWPKATPPTGWLICNGSTFDKVKYPRLAVAYPAGVLPDLRGEFIRGWDNGRGVDAGRSVLSAQEGSKLRQSASTTAPGAGNGANVWDNFAFDEITESTLYSTSTTTTGQVFKIGVTRPRNVAFNYIVRAA